MYSPLSAFYCILTYGFSRFQATFAPDADVGSAVAEPRNDADEGEPRGQVCVRFARNQEIPMLFHPFNSVVFN